LAFVVLRAIRIARSRSALAAELKAAQNVQQLLLTHAAQPTPGFLIESVYLPAAEVGGDFYFVSPAPDGSITAIIGDVSGKGMQAAMRVAMILGVLRREDSREPASILGSLNQALHSQGGVGFTTACCVRLQPDGSFSIANAGHISPYVEGAEYETSPGLPLGLTAETEYEERSGQLGSHSRMVLLSDGVVEARSRQGELYGFDRLGALTLEPAEEIAATAQAFGQEDDITVLTLACTA
jgi:serine phosphatase RsbU (regulator of sigma subunit)